MSSRSAFRSVRSALVFGRSRSRWGLRIRSGGFAARMRGAQSTQLRAGRRRRRRWCRQWTSQPTQRRRAATCIACFARSAFARRRMHGRSRDGVPIRPRDVRTEKCIAACESSEANSGMIRLLLLDDAGGRVNDSTRAEAVASPCSWPTRGTAPFSFMSAMGTRTVDFSEATYLPRANGDELSTSPSTDRFRGRARRRLPLSRYGLNDDAHLLRRLSSRAWAQGDVLARAARTRR